MELFDNMVKNVKKAAGTAKERSSKLAEIAKIRYRIASEKTKLDGLYEELGRLAYKQNKEGAVVLDEIEEKVSQIDVSLATVENLKIKLRIAKKRGEDSGETAESAFGTESGCGEDAKE